MARSVGVLFIGANGSVATTTVAGVRAVVRGLVAPRGMIADSAPCAGLDLAGLDDLVFGGWDIKLIGRYDQAVAANGVVPPELTVALADDLAGVTVWPGVVAHLSSTIRQLGAATPIQELSPREAVEQVVADIARFRADRGLDDVIVVNTSSTEPPVVPSPIHDDLSAFDRALDDGSLEITNGMLYGYAALQAGCPFVNFTPSVAVEIPALRALAVARGLPLAGQDAKTGQTLYKTVLAPMLRIRGLKVRGWYSVNILGNTDGLVLDDARHKETKVHTKESVLESILGYGDFTHRVRIDYYPPRGDRKEAWDSVDFEGWLGEPMTMRINWQASDSILAAPLVVDLVRLVDLAHRRGERGPLPQLAMFFKAPYGTDVHDFFAQYALFERWAAEAAGTLSS